uniref:Uncharacterized protein n=1 Tax=Magallana gigas TaxID=29159 RepID=K1RH80_MAGGI
MKYYALDVTSRAFRKKFAYNFLQIKLRHTESKAGHPDCADKKHGMCTKDRKGFNRGDKSSVYILVWKGHTMVRNVYHGPPYWYGLQLDMG